MGSHEQLTPSEKIQRLRTAANYTQLDLAEALGCTKSKVSRVENDKWGYSDEDIAAAKQFFGIDNAPLTDKELIDFKQRLYGWKNLIKNRQTEEARRYQSDLAVIKKLPFEPELSTLYRMFEIRLVLTEANVALAEEMLLSEAPLIEGASKENRHFFNYNMGSLYFWKWDFKTALQYYLNARSLEAYVLEKDASLDLNLAICYGMRGKYTLAIGTIEGVYDLFNYNKTSIMHTYVNSILAINYVRIGQVTRAKRLLDKSLSVTFGNEGKVQLGNALHNYGCACKKSKEYQEAISYFDQAFEYFETGDKFYMENMYWKIYCLIQLKDIPKVKVLLAKIRPLSEGNEHYLIIFESLSHLLTINDEASIDFIEKKTIPYLMEKYEYFRIFDYCDVLEKKFTIRINNGYKKRLLDLKEIILKITKEITFGEEVTFDEEKTCGHYIDTNDGS